MEIMPNNISLMQEESPSQLSENKSFASPVALTGPLLSFDERQRVKAVNRLRILGSNQSDENFDRLSRLASRHFQVRGWTFQFVANFTFNLNLQSTFRLLQLASPSLTTTEYG
jgi:hypothetical protein